MAFFRRKLIVFMELGKNPGGWQGYVAVVQAGHIPDRLNRLALAEVFGVERHDSSVRVSAN